MNHRVTDYALNFDKKKMWERKVQLGIITNNKQGHSSIKTAVYNQE